MKNATGKSTPFNILLTGMILFLTFLLLNCQAGGGPSSVNVVPSSVPEIKEAIKQSEVQDKALREAEEAAGKLPASGERTTITSSLGVIRRGWGVISGGLTRMYDSAVACERLAKENASLRKENTGLKSADPARSTLNWLGIGAVVLAGLVLVFTLTPWGKGIDGIRPAAFAGIAFGALMLTFSYYLTEIRWLVVFTVIGGIVSAGIWFWTHRREVVKKAIKASAAFGDVPAPKVEN